MGENQGHLTTTKGSTRMTSCLSRECTQPSHVRKSASLAALTSICMPDQRLCHSKALGALN